MEPVTQVTSIPILQHPKGTVVQVLVWNNDQMALQWKFHKNVFHWSQQEIEQNFVWCPFL